MKTAESKGRKIFYAKRREEWREWLKEHFESENEIWFVFPAKDSGEEGVTYNDAVEEALCFGWIDSTAGKLDEKHGIRRFTKRRQGSGYSQPNIERLVWLDKHGMIHPSVRESVSELISTPYRFPEDIQAEIRKDAKAWENYQKFSEPYRRIRIAYIEAAKDRPEEYRKRLENFIAKTREGKMIMGYGGIEKYYR